jgi:hypothetical protein
VNLADARARSTKSGLPPELVRAWQTPAQAAQVRREPKVEEWSAGAASGGKRGKAIKRAWLAAGAVVAAVGLTAGGLALTGHHSPAGAASGPIAGGSNPAIQPNGSSSQSSGSSSHSVAAAQTYAASGLPFAAEFPASPTKTQQHLHLLNVPFTATTYTSTSGSTTESVGVYPLPLGNGAHFDLANFVHAFLGMDPSSTTLTPGPTTTFQGMKAVPLAATSSGGNEAFFGLLVLDGHVVYEVLVSGPATTVDTDWHAALAKFRVVHPALGTSF